MDRRSFIKSSSILGTGLVVGIGADQQIAIGAEIVDTGAWLRIAPDNSVTINNARSEMGQDVYTTMAMLIVEELDYPLNKVKVEIAPANAVYINSLLGGQITGGSTSVREAWDKLRLVGATAKAQLKAAAASKWNVPVTSVNASLGILSSGKFHATYGDMATEAASIKITNTPTLKTTQEYRYIGKAFPRLDTPSKVNATAVYGIDVRQPEMLVASLAQSPVISGKVKSVDSSAAKAIKGVISVVEIPDGVAVLAKDFHIAKKGRDALKIEWQNPDIKAFENSASIEQGLHAAHQKNGAIVGKAGNFSNPLQDGAKTITADYFLPYQAHATLEPVNCAAYVQNGECHVWGPIQFQQGAQGVAAAASGLPPEKVFIHTTFIGGGYGRKLELDFISQAVAISKASGKAIRLLWTREDDMTHDFYRPISLHTVSASVDSKGKITGLSSKMTSQSVTARAFPPFVVDGNDPFMNEGSVNLTYDIPNLRIENVIHETGVRVGYWRAVSNNLNTFALESFIDELAEQTSQDPVKMRMELLSKHPRAQKVLATAAKKAGWGLKRSNGHTLGVAQSEAYGAYITVIAEISIGKDAQKTPKVHKLTAVVDPGIAIRPDQVKAQLESGMLLGLSSAMKTQITFKDGIVEQKNFDSYPMLRMSETPTIDITIIEGGGKPSGMGEVGVPCVAPALVNAIAAATGQRIRSLPVIKV